MTRIMGIVGPVGMGKTLLATYLAYREHLHGRTIITNYATNFSDKVLDNRKLIEELKKQDQFENTLLVIDEMNAFIDSRRATAKTNLVVTDFLRHTRKLGVDLVWTSQYAHMVDLRLREFTDTRFDPLPYSLWRYQNGGQKPVMDRQGNILPADDYYGWFRVLRQDKDRDGNYQFTGLFDFDARPLFRMYNTYEQVFMQHDTKTKGKRGA